MVDQNHPLFHGKEEHAKTARKIAGMLAEQYPLDFPEVYREQNMNMERLFMRWHREFDDRFSRLVHEDLKNNGDENFLTLFEKAAAPIEKQVIIDELKRRLY